jgi:hypothetical protein
MLIQEKIWWVRQITITFKFGDYHKLFAPKKSNKGEYPRLLFQISCCVHKMMIIKTL